VQPGKGLKKIIITGVIAVVAIVKKFFKRN